MGDREIFRPRSRSSWGSTLAAAADEFLSTPGVANPNTRRAHASAIDGTIEAVGGRDRPLADVTYTEIGAALTALWGQCAPATWNRTRAAVEDDVGEVQVAFLPGDRGSSVGRAASA